MRNKTAAGLFALFFGWAGVHRFYLGQVGLGVVYFFLMFIFISPILSLIDAIVFFSMDEETFNRKYNTNQQLVPPIYHRRPGYPQAQNRSSGKTQRNVKMSAMELQNPYKANGIKKYKEFDLEGAIDDFNKGLEIQANDISLHFNLACAYSLTEQVDKAYAHLDKAVALGFTDFEKIKTHDDLAYVRIQDRFDAFKANGFRLELPPVETTTVEVKQEKETIQDDVLLSQLKRLAELRDRGLLSEQEFIIEKKKLTR